MVRRVLGLGPLIAIPADVVGAVRALPRVLAQIDAIAEATSSLPRMETEIAQVADAAQVLPPMYERMLREPLKLALGMLQIGIVEIGSAEAKSRFPILRRLSATAIVPREHGVEGWLWTRAGGSAMTIVGDPDKAPNAALLFTKPLGDDHLRSFAPEALEEIAARSPLGSPPRPEITRPWCEGDGRRIIGHDAQAARKTDA